MKLTLSEAEAILSRVFSLEIGTGGKVEIDVGAPSGVNVPSATIDQMLSMMVRNNMKIEAIKLTRQLKPSMGLAEAKAYVENLP